MPKCEIYDGETAYLDKKDGIVYCRIGRENCPHNLEGSLIEKPLTKENPTKEILIQCLGAGFYGNLTKKEKQENERVLNKYYFPDRQNPSPDLIRADQEYPNSLL